MVVDQYEAERQANIAANAALLQSLGLVSQQTAANKAVRAKASAKQATKQRSSSSPPPSPPAAQRSQPRRQVRLTKPYKFGKRLDSPSVDDPRRTSGRLRRPTMPFGEDQLLLSPMASVIEDDDDDDDQKAYAPTGRGSAQHMPLRNAQRLGHRRHDPKRFGPIPDIPVGTWWATRMDCSTDAVHAPTVAGISGNGEMGCYSLALSGGYSDDVDLGDHFTYTGSGGRKLQGFVDGKRISLRTAPQTFDQSFEDSHNAALLRSAKTGRPIRVIRGYKGESVWSPSEGYIYCGLYTCTRAWMGVGSSGFKVCKYAFERLPNQAPLPVPSDSSSESAESGPLSASAAPARPRHGWTIEVVVTRASKPCQYHVYPAKGL